MTIQRQKEILIATFLVLYSLLFFMGVILYTGLGVDRTPLATTLVVIGALIWTALVVTANAFIINRSGMSGLTIVIPPILVVVLGKFSLDAIIGAAIVLLFLTALQRKITWEITNHVTFKMSVLYESTRLALFTLLVIGITLSLPSIIQGFKSDSDIVPTKYVSAVSKPLEPLLAKWLPGYRTDRSLDDIIDAQIQTQTGGFVPTDNPLVLQQKSELRSQLGQQLGLQLTGRETAVTIASRLINSHLFRLTQTNHYLTVAIVIIVTFLAMKALVPILVWPVLLVVKIFFYLASRIGLISFMKTTIEAQRFTL